MLKVIDKGREYPIEKIILLDGFKQIVLRPTQDINYEIQLPVEFLHNPNLKEIKDFIEKGNFVLKERIYFYWLFTNEELLKKYASQFYRLKEEGVNKYGAYTKKNEIIVVFGGDSLQGRGVFGF